MITMGARYMQQTGPIMATGKRMNCLGLNPLLLISSASMILTIPYPIFDIQHIQLSPFQSHAYGKNIAHLSYHDPSIEFRDVNLLTPSMVVEEYQPEHSRLRVNISAHPTFQIKLQTLHEYIVSTFYVHQMNLLHIHHESHESIRKLFHFLLEDSSLFLYIYPTSLVKCENGTTCRVSELVPGDKIRCVIRFHGISKLTYSYGVRLRFQHTIPSLWKLSS